MLAVSLYWVLSGKPSVYLVDFAVFEPPANWAVTKAEIMDLVRKQGCYSEEALEFQVRSREGGGVRRAGCVCARLR